MHLSISTDSEFKTGRRFTVRIEVQRAQSDDAPQTSQVGISVDPALAGSLDLHADTGAGRIASSRRVGGRRPDLA